MWTQLRDEILPTSGTLTHSRGVPESRFLSRAQVGRMEPITKGLFGISIMVGVIPGTGDTAVSRTEERPTLQGLLSQQLKG